MKIVYLGTPDFAVAPLKNLIENGYNVVAVVTNVDKPVGRKKILTAPPVKEYAKSVGIPVFQYNKIRLEGVNDLKQLAPDLMITCAFGQILSQEILDVAPLGVINIHASLLPKYRGASPIHHAILNGEKETGITIMKTDIGIDTGDILFQEKLDVLPNETCGELFDRLSVVGADAIIKALKLIENGQATFTKQDNSLATHTKMIQKEDAKIDWNKTSEEVFNQIRAYNPAPIAYTYMAGEKLKIFSAEKVKINGKSGQVLDGEKELIIACKEGALRILSLQKEGGKLLQTADFLRGNKIEKGVILG